MRVMAVAILRRDSSLYACERISDAYNPNWVCNLVSRNYGVSALNRTNYCDKKRHEKVEHLLLSFPITKRIVNTQFMY